MGRPVRSGLAGSKNREGSRTLKYGLMETSERLSTVRSDSETCQLSRSPPKFERSPGATRIRDSTHSRVGMIRLPPPSGELGGEGVPTKM